MEEEEFHISPATARKLVLFLIGAFVIFLLLIGYVFAQSYIGRHNLAKAEKQARLDLTNASRQACNRGKKDRKANALGWRTAQVARLQGVAKELHITLEQATKLMIVKPTLKDPPDLVAARKYDVIARGLEARAQINCKEAFP